MSRHSSQLVVYMFEEDYEQVIKDTVSKYPDMETGGDLFGLWTSERRGLRPLVHIVLGPGEKCKRTKVSFYQDVPYLKRVGSSLSNNYMLGHIGEWHSHHRLTLCEPSSGDYSTVTRNYPNGYHGFLLIIANIMPDKEVTLSPFLFRENTEEMTRGKVALIPGRSPFRADKLITEAVNQGAEGRGAGPLTRFATAFNNRVVAPITQSVLCRPGNSGGGTTEQRLPPPTASTASNHGDAPLVVFQENDDQGIENEALEKETALEGGETDSSPQAAESTRLPNSDADMPPDFWYRSEYRDKTLEDMFSGIQRVTPPSEEPFPVSFSFSGGMDQKKAAEVLSKLQEISGDEKIKLAFHFSRGSARWTAEFPADFPRSYVTLQRVDRSLPGQAKAEIQKDDIKEIFDEFSKVIEKHTQEQ